MNVKKLAIIGAIALVIIGSVLAAGCTSTTSTDNSNSITGMWTTKYTDENGTTSTAIMYINPNGKEYWVTLDDTFDGIQFQKLYVGTWAKSNDDTFTITNNDIKQEYTYVYNKANNTFTSSRSNRVYTKAEPIVGIWSGTSSEKTGKGNSTMIFKPDGTGNDTISYTDGTAMVAKLTWKKNADGSIATSFSNGLNRTYTVAADGKTMKSEDNRSFTKQFLDTTGIKDITGTWVCNEKKYTAIFNGDSTGTYFDPNTDVGISHFTWKFSDTGNIILNYIDGKTQDGKDIKGKEYSWTYNIDNYELTDGDGNVFTRPTESGNGITLTFTTSSSEPWVGVWVRNSTGDTSKGFDTYKYLRADGKEFYMVLDTEKKGIRFKDFGVGTWVKTDDSTFTVTDEKTEELYEYKYNKENNTLLSSSSNHAYTKVEPIVGFWSGTSSERTKNGNSTLIFKQDGTGLNVIGHSNDGTADVYTFTWKKNSDGTIPVTFSTGFVSNFTVAADGNTMKSEDNRTFTKQFLDETFLVETPGAWYNKENNHTVNFNADGTGFFNSDKYGLSHFTWKFGDTTNSIIVTYTDGKTQDGKDIKGKVYSWTYDPENDELTDGDGNKFTRTNESVKGKITYY